MKKADHAFEGKEYALAATYYAEIANESDDRAEKQKAVFQAAECYRLNHDPKRAEKYYERAIKYGVKDPIVIYRLAEAKKQQGKFEEALVEFKKYQKLVPDDERVETMIVGCESALKWKEERTRYTVEEFKPANETASDDFSPMWADRRAKTMMFTSDREEGRSKESYVWTGRYHTDVWILKMEGKRGKEKWGQPTIVEGLNTKYNDGVIAFNKRYSKMYITQCNGEDGKEPNCKIFEARKVGLGYEMEEEPLDFCKDETQENRWNYGHPTLSPDDKTMYFVSDRPGGYGDTGEVNATQDVWMVTYVRRGRTWSDPINLGPQINTEGNEMFPYMHKDGSLYFSSDGHPGMGGLDIFNATKSGDGPTDWNVPVNMKSPINSNADDFGIILDNTKEHGYFTSNRKKEKDDIFEFHMEPIVCTLKGQVTDCDSGTAIAEAMVVISNNNDTTKIRLLTDAKGYYETPLSINTNYTIEVTKRADYYYDAKPQYVSTMGVENSLDCQHIKDFCLKNTCNDVFVLPIYYDLDESFIRDDAKPILDDLIAKLKKYPKMKVELGSHTDCRADFEYNRALSQRRADSAISYLIDNGEINPFRLEARGYGESQLVNHCECEGNRRVDCTDDEHQQNRRTTVKVVNCNFDVLSIGIDYELRNDSALLGKGSIYSPYLLDQQRQYIIDTKGNIDSFLRAQELQEVRDQEMADSIALMAKYDVIPMSMSRDLGYVYAYAGRKKMKLLFNGEERRTLISQEVVVQLLNSKVITLADFKDGKDKIKLPNGMKVYSTSFTIPELKIGDMVFTNVRCKMTEERSKLVLGYNTFNDYEDFEIKDGKIWLLKEPE
ncbi:MAG: PD40 domain-containing protein [Bacteroidia bacterium]